MKKILVIAGVAVMAASSAFAVSPSRQADLSKVAVKADKAERVAPAVRKDIKGRMSLNGKANSRLTDTKFNNRFVAAAEGDAEVAASLSARYMTPPIGVFYTGTSPDGLVFPFKTADGIFGTFALGGNYGRVPFLNTSTGAKTYEWGYNFMVDGDETPTPVTVDTENLIVDIDAPWTSFDAPVLTVFDGDNQETYEDPNVIEYLFAPNLNSFGINPSNVFSDWDESEGLADYWGVTTCPVNIRAGGGLYLYEFTKDMAPAAEDANYYAADGTCVLWPNYVNQAYGKNYNISNVKMSEFIASLPMQMQPYLMDQMWLSVVYNAKSDVTLNVTVYAVDDEGYIRDDAAIGSGEITLEATKGQAQANVVVDLESVDEEGFPTSNPLAIYGDAAVILSGIENEDLTFFAPIFNGGTEIPAEADLDDYYFANAAVGLSFNAVPKDDPTSAPLNAATSLPTAALDYGPEGAPTVYYPCNLDWCYNIMFPFVLNVEGGYTHEVNVPVAGGDVEYFIDSAFPITDLMAEGLMTVETENADWFTFTVGEGTYTEDGKDYQLDQVKIKAQALPEGKEGRYGVIKFRGYACDFNLYVGQGKYEISGIDSVNAANGKVELYDLQGRRLSAAPTHGIYIERQGNKAVKRIAK